MLRRRVLAAALIVLLPVAAEWSGGLRPLATGLTALRMGWAPRVPSGEIVLVDVDAKSIAALGTWPWSRRVHAEIIDRLMALDAAEIAFDIDFSASSTEAEDEALAGAIQRASGSVILAAFVQKLTASAAAEQGFNRPLDRLAKSAWIGSVNVHPDSDGFVRHYPFGIVAEGTAIPSIPALLNGGRFEAGREFLIDFSIDAKAIRRISAVDVLRGNVEASIFSGRKIIVGSQAAELRDFFNTPVAGLISGSLLQALATETLMQDRALHPTSDLIGLAGLMLLAFAALALGQVRCHIMVFSLAIGCILIEIAAISLQAALPVVANTAPWHLACLVLALVAILSEIDFARIVQTFWRVRAHTAETILAQVVADNHAGILVIGEDGTVAAASQAAATILEFDGELAGRPASNLLPDVLAQEIALALAYPEGQNASRHHGETQFGGQDGSERTIEYVVTLSRVRSQPTGDKLPPVIRWVACLTFLDVTVQRAALARIAHMARFDGLTGLPNRNQLTEKLDLALLNRKTRGLPCATVCFDLDGFKNVNDTLGHAIGDMLLCEVAKRACEILPAGAIVARLGGDEFVAIISDEYAEPMAISYAKQLIERIREPFNIGAHRVIITASVGVALGARNEDAGQMLMGADIALYRAKAEGRNTIVTFEREMLATLAARQSLERDLWQALDSRQFEVWYQPQVDLRTGVVVGAEALVRWVHPTRGIVSPDDFIPVAEAIGLIEPLGRWVLETACFEASHWQASIKLAVNVSSAQFMRCDMNAVVAQALQQSGLPASALELEITESLFMKPSDSVHAALEQLRSIGISIALDDFGTGFSSLSSLHRFPVDKIKIDRSFVSSAPPGSDSAAIVRAIVALADALNIRLNAEGIETAAQAALLQRLGVREGQGYLYGKPLPARGFVRLLAEPDTLAKLTA